MPCNCSCNSLAYQDGYNAWRKGFYLSNPYKSGLQEYGQWQKGYDAAEWEKDGRWYCR